jgi:ribosomal protein L44E
MSFSNDYQMHKIHKYDTQAQEEFAETQRYIQSQRRQNRRFGNFVKIVATSIANSFKQIATSPVNYQPDESPQEAHESVAETQYGQRVMASS